MASETVHGRRSLLSLLFHFLKRLDKMMWINIVTLVHNLAGKVKCIIFAHHHYVASQQKNSRKLFWLFSLFCPSHLTLQSIQSRPYFHISYVLLGL